MVKMKMEEQLEAFVSGMILSRMYWRLISVLLRVTYKFKTGFSIQKPYCLRGLRFCKIGEYFTSRSGLWLECISQYGDVKFAPQVLIGCRVSMGRNVHIACAYSVEIGANTLMGSNILITDHSHGSYGGEVRRACLDEIVLNRKLNMKPVFVGCNVWIGDNVVILPGARVGNNCVIGAGAIIKGVIAPDSIVVGSREMHQI